jgi:VanZ family protein
MQIAALPRPLRLAAFTLAVAVLLYLCLAPADELPQVNMWDKVEHSLAFLVLMAAGLILFPRHVRALAGGSFALGVLIEVLQANMHLGRQGDWHDVVGDTVGIVVALILWALFGRFHPHR